MDGLSTTNWMLGILAVASVIQTCVLLGVAVGAYKAYQLATRAIETKLTPSIMRLEGLLANLEHTAAVVRTRTENVDHALGTARNAAARLGTVWPRAAVAASVAGGVVGAVRRWRAGRGASESVKVVAG